jgi:cell division protein FtsQ
LAAGVEWVGMELSPPLRLLADWGLRRSPIGRAARTRPRSAGARGGDVGGPNAWSGLSGLALDALRARRLPVRLAVYAALALPLSGGGWLWLRDSSLVAVRHVHIAGVHGPQAIEIRHALDAAAERMGTLHYSAAALRAAVSSYPEVATVAASAGFPHTLSIRVGERRAVAVLVGPGVHTAIAADGTVLGPALVSGSLPTVAAKTAPAPGTRPREASALEAAAVLGAAPAPLLGYVTSVYDGAEGLTLQMRNGLVVYFGDASRPHAKWLSLARVLASRDAAGALYIDVRLPERPAAGFTQPGSARASANALTPAQVGSADPAAAKLAEQLSAEVGGGGTTGPSESGKGSESSAPSTSAPSGESGEESAAARSQPSESSAAGAPAGEAVTAPPGG